jgi:hypothetical protein
MGRMVQARLQQSLGEITRLLEKHRVLDGASRIQARVNGIAESWTRF